MARGSRQRISEYINAFSEIDDTRLDLLKYIVEQTCLNINNEDTEDIESLIDIQMDKLEFINEVAANIINAFEENGVLNAT